MSTLYIVATPIGNLGDFSSRAIQILNEVDFIICEDTRNSSKLLNHFHIKNKLNSLYKDNETTKASYFINKLLESPDKKCALISDAGTPCISDPGSLLIQECHKHGIQVLSLPGPTSFVCAAAASGFKAPHLLFAGFFPRENSKKIEEMEKWNKITPSVLVFFESPNRIIATLKFLYRIFEDKYDFSVSKEISKIYEFNKVGKLSEHLKYFENLEKIKGEFVVVIDMHSPFKNEEKLLDISESSLILEMNQYLSENLNVSIKDVSVFFSKKYKLNKKYIYNLLINI